MIITIAHLREMGRKSQDDEETCDFLTELANELEQSHAGHADIWTAAFTPVTEQ